VQENLVSFPSQVPVFGRQARPELQPRIVVLYFVRGWTMDEIAKRCGLGRQRIGQMLTAWRIRAVKEGYIQAIDPTHALFKRVRSEQASQFGKMLEWAGLDIPQTPQEMGPAVPALGVRERSTSAIRDLSKLKASALAEQLEVIVAILNNQLRLCSRPFNGNLASCESLLASARTLCFRLERQVPDTRTNDEGNFSRQGVVSLLSTARSQAFQLLVSPRKRPQRCVQQQSVGLGIVSEDVPVTARLARPTPLPLH
jgi:hypothetical protein